MRASFRPIMILPIKLLTRLKELLEYSFFSYDWVTWWTIVLKLLVPKVNLPIILWTINYDPYMGYITRIIWLEHEKRSQSSAKALQPIAHFIFISRRRINGTTWKRNKKSGGVSFRGTLDIQFVLIWLKVCLKLQTGCETK